MPVTNPALTSALNAYFTQKNIADVLSALPKAKTPIRDMLFPESARKQKASPYLAIADIENATGAVPVIKRGSRSYPVDGGSKTTQFIEVASLSPSRFLSAVELNNASAFGDTANINAKLSEVVEDLRDRTVRSTEILCCQSLSGKIKYPLATANGSAENYEVDLGAPKTQSPVDITGKKIGELIKILEAHYVAQQNTGSGGDIRFLAGSDVYAKIIDIITTSTQNNIPISWTDFGLTLAGKYKIMPLSSTYTLPGKTTVTPVIEAKKMQTLDLSDTGKLFYAALDDFDAKLAPLPFFSKYVTSDDPSGIKVISASKPLPAFAVSRSIIGVYLA